MLPFRKILCPTDFSEVSQEAVKAAAELARYFGAELWFLHAVAPAPVIATGSEPVSVYSALTETEFEDSARKSLEEIAAQFESAGLKTQLTVLKGDIADEILRSAEEGHVDLIVIAAHDGQGSARLVSGSIAEKVVRFSPCPVLTVRSLPSVAGEKSEKWMSSGSGEPGEKGKGVLGDETPEKAATYLKRLEGQLKEWDAGIDRLVEVVQASKEDVKAKYGQQIDDLRRKQEAAQNRLTEMRETGEAAWEGLKSAMEKSIWEIKETYDGVFLKLKEMKEKAQEKSLKKKQAYSKKVETELREWGATTELLKAKANRSKAEAKVRYVEEIERLQSMQKEAMQKLQELKNSGGEAWVDLKGGLDRAVSELKKSLGNAFSRFKENREN